MIKPGLDRDQFADAFTQLAASISNAAYILEIRNDGNFRPVGVILAIVKNHVMEPHVDWFPWATQRNKVEALVEFINEARKEFMLMIYAKQETWKFFEHVMKHGIIRRVGKIEDYFDWSEPAMFFQSITRAF